MVAKTGRSRLAQLQAATSSCTLFQPFKWHSLLAGYLRCRECKAAAARSWAKGLLPVQEEAYCDSSFVMCLPPASSSTWGWATEWFWLDLYFQSDHSYVLPICNAPTGTVEEDSSRHIANQKNAAGAIGSMLLIQSPPLTYSSDSQCACCPLALKAAAGTLQNHWLLFRGDPEVTS